MKRLDFIVLPIFELFLFTYGDDVDSGVHFSCSDDS